MTNRYRIKAGVDLEGVELLPTIIRVGMIRDALFASVRWAQSVQPEIAAGRSITASVDRLHSIIVGAGWAWEAVNCARDLSKEGHIQASDVESVQLDGDVDLRQIWRACSSDPEVTPVIRHIKCIRDQCAFHFDPRVANRAISHVRSGELENVFMEWDEDDRRDVNSCFALGWLASAEHVFKLAIDPPEFNPSDVGDQILKIACLMNHLFDLLVGKSGLEFEPCE